MKNEFKNKRNKSIFKNKQGDNIFKIWKLEKELKKEQEKKDREIIYNFYLNNNKK